MKLFQCENCGQLVYFENTRCENCGHALGYDAEQHQLLTLAPAQNDQWLDAGTPSQIYRSCANAVHNVCNWLVTAESMHTLCPACRLNRTIPDLTISENLTRWQKLELAKHRLIYSLLQFNLPIVSKIDDERWGLTFDFLADVSAVDNQESTVTTGHADGVITINLSEADDAKREQIRQSLAEPYRTLLGHFRHEIAHYYWMHFARSEQWLEEFRRIFGDERSDYATALQEHYAKPSVTGWSEQFISAYAEAHPWEDWAECWAHYFHLVDTLETAYVFGIQVQPLLNVDETLSTDMAFNAYQEPDFKRIIASWLPVTYALNSLNRSMGHADLYPFILTPAVQEKIAFVHNSIRTRMESI